MAEILLIQAGGTIDKDYPAGERHHGYNFVIGKPAAKAVFARGKVPYSIGYCSACQKDSLDMTDDDREIIKKVVASFDIYTKIIITHGTDTIHETARYLSSLDIGNKVVVLTGSMNPERFRESDADFNLGMAVGAVYACQPGVYIALNGRVARWDEFPQ